MTSENQNSSNPPQAGSTATVRKVNPNLFRRCLLDNMQDGAIFVDFQSRILVWSQTVEVMTGMSFSKVDGVTLTPTMLGLSTEHGTKVADNKCPVQACFESRTKQTGSYKLVGRSGREIKVEMTIAPVVAADDTLHGAVILVHDTSVQLDLQRQLKDLYAFSMLDPLTQVANRAEFERVLDEFIRLRNSTDLQCSLIICDIDFFKSINDNYNHHSGDQALVSFASLLKKFVRQQDLVARYGGEEFVILCANCDVEDAVQRAEEIRVTLTKTPQQMLDGKCITASFGVAELMPGDIGTDFFVRADTALLRAKELGRNQVVEANTGGGGRETTLRSAEQTSLSGASWRKLKGQVLISEEYQTQTPLTVLIEKLRGYIIETEPEILRVDSDFASMTVEVEDENDYSKKGTFILNVEFQELENKNNTSIGPRMMTYIRISVREGKKRKWFATNAVELAPQVVKDIQTFLMLNDHSSKLKIDPQATKSNR